MQMTSGELIARMTELDLSITDIALVGGTSRRAVEKWRSGQHPVPRAIALILDAMLDGKIDGDWLIEWLSVRVSQS